MTTITLTHVTKRFEQTVGESRQTVTAVNNLSLKILSGETLAILGPSGCGKSTVLRIIAGLTIPDSGEVLFDQTPLNDIPTKDRGIGMVFQDGALMPHWETEKTVGFFLWLRKRQAEVPARVARISQITGIGLEHLLTRKPSQLSGGEKQRIGIARALARDPRVFLFDEPFSNLDAKLRTQGRVELKRLLQEFPVTSVYVTHDQIEAVALAHRVAVMREGAIEQIGTYHHLYHNPVNLFVATFVGTPTINLFEGFVIDHHWRGVNFGGYRVRGDLPDGTPVLLGVRAEAMKLDENGVEVHVDEVTPHFPERQQEVVVSAPGERWTMLLPLEPAIRRGDILRCAPDEGAIHCFDKATGKRIG
jgi:multiple sugar transport system ATP-binding protein